MHIKLTEGVPIEYTLRKLRADNPKVGFATVIADETLAEYGVYPYTRLERPEYDTLTSRLVDGGFKQDSVGNWVRGYVVEQLPVDRAERNIRSNRDSLLQETDWVVTKAYETNESVPFEWAVYRQSLRDITGQAGFPYAVTWPMKPG